MIFFVLVMVHLHKDKSRKDLKKHMKEFIYVLSANGEKCLYGTKQEMLDTALKFQKKFPSYTFQIEKYKDRRFTTPLEIIKLPNK